MRNKIILRILPLLISLIILLNVNIANALDAPLEAELTIEEETPFVEYGADSVISLKFVQRGLNWTYLEKAFGPIFTKILWPTIMFRDLKQFLGYNSVIFQAEVIGNPQGWAASIEPSSVSKFTGESSVDLKLHIKVSRPSTNNTALVRVKYIAYGGDNLIMGEASNDIIVSVRPFHLAEIKPVNNMNIASPNTIVYIPIEVTNLGNYEDTFNFKINNKDNDLVATSAEQISLNPGETGQINVMVLTPQTYLYDFGTGRTLNISAYSLLNTSAEFPFEIQIVTRGFFISELFLVSIILLIIIIFILYFIASRFKNKVIFKKKKKEIVIKPKVDRKAEQERIKKEEKPVEIKKEEPFVVEPKVDRQAEEDRKKKEKALVRIRKQQRK